MVDPAALVAPEQNIFRYFEEDTINTHLLKY
jgi:hypothetical protein